MIGAIRGAQCRLGLPGGAAEANSGHAVFKGLWISASQLHASGKVLPRRLLADDWLTLWF